jgi:hypothetical protein
LSDSVRTLQVNLKLLTYKKQFKISVNRENCSKLQFVN